MSEQKKNPLVIGLVSLIPNIITAISGIVKDKKDKKAEATLPATTGEAIAESIKGITEGSFSSKRLLNLGGTGLIIALAYADITIHGITKANLVLIALGVTYSLGMSLITFLSERKDKFI